MCRHLCWCDRHFTLLSCSHLLLVLDNVGSSVEVRKQVTEFLSALLRRTVNPAVLVTAEHAMGAELLTDAEKVGVGATLHAPWLAVVATWGRSGEPTCCRVDAPAPAVLHALVLRRTALHAPEPTQAHSFPWRLVCVARS